MGNAARLCMKKLRMKRPELGNKKREREGWWTGRTLDYRSRLSPPCQSQGLVFPGATAGSTYRSWFNPEDNLEQPNSLNHSIHKLTETIAESAIENPEVKLLMGFTGIDHYSAMFLINEIGPITRFDSPKKLVIYAGLAPSTRQSGNHPTHGPITKEGNAKPLIDRRSRNRTKNPQCFFSVQAR